MTIFQQRIENLDEYRLAELLDMHFCDGFCECGDSDGYAHEPFTRLPRTPDWVPASLHGARNAEVTAWVKENALTVEPLRLALEAKGLFKPRPDVFVMVRTASYEDSLEERREAYAA